jgi:dCMP deaminase
MLLLNLVFLKLIISAGIKEVFYEITFNSDGKALVRDSFIQEGLVTFKQIKLSEEIAQQSSLFLLHSTSGARTKNSSPKES